MPELSFDPKPVGYLRPHQIESLKEDREFLVKTLQDPNLQERGDTIRQLQRLDHQVATQTPPILSAESRDAVQAQLREVEAYIQDGMCSHDEMRRNPDGAVGKHRKHESKKIKAMLLWKDLVLMLNPGDTDPDLCNTDRLRPTTSTLGMHDVQIQPQEYHFAPPTDEWKKRWDDTFGDLDPKDILNRQEALELRMAAINKRLDAAESVEASAAGTPPPPKRPRRKSTAPPPPPLGLADA